VTGLFFLLMNFTGLVHCELCCARDVHVCCICFCATANEQVSHDAKLPFEWAHTLLFVAALVRCGAVALGLVHVAEAVFSEAHAMDNMNLHMLQVCGCRCHRDLYNIN
jgi:hypothetical protein